MKKQRYIVEIEMPDGDFISAGWLKALIQTDCNVENEGRQKVTVQEISFPSNLDDAADKNALIAKPDLWDATDSGTATPLFYMSSLRAAFKAGAEWLAGQGETVEGVFRAGDPGYPDIRMGEQYSIEHILRKPGGIEPGDDVVVQIRKK